MLTPDHAASLAFLQWWLPAGPWCLAAIHPDERDKKDYLKARVFRSEESAETLKWLETHTKHNVYYTANLVKPDVKATERPSREDLAALICLHADIDPRVGENVTSEQERILRMITSPRPRDLPDPTVVVFTGGGYQTLWRLKEPVPIKDLAHAEGLARYNLQIRNLLEGDSAQDIGRILRLPGTINWPNKLKVKKGRTPALACVVEQHDDRTYDLREFLQAPEVQETSATRQPSTTTSRLRLLPKVEVGGNLRRVEDVSELPETVPAICKVIIVQGDNPDDRTQFNGDRSLAVWYVACELVRQKVPDDVIFSILTDPGFGISAHVLDQPRSEKYALRQIERAHEHAVDPDLRELNERYSIISNFGGRCRVMEEVWDDRLKRSALTTMTFEDFRNSYLNQRKELEDKEKMPLAEWWLRHPHRRQYDRLIFQPNDEDVGSCYNLWRGFGVEPVPGNCSMFLDHLRKTLCGNDEDYYLYLLRWMANAVQNPGAPGQVAIVLKGRMGTGKGAFARMFGRLFGRHYLAISDSKRLTSNFNAHLRDCVLLFADEAFYAGDKKHESILKALITEDLLAIESKGKDIEVSGNCLHLLMASNEDWAVPASMDDRRFFVLDVKDNKRNAHGYFRQMDEQMVAGGYSALLDTLMKLDISQWDVREKPGTKALETEKMMSLDAIEAYWYECLRNGDLGLLDSKLGGWPERIAKGQLFDEVKRRLPHNSRHNNVSIGLLFQKKFLPPDVDGSLRIGGTSIWRDAKGNERATVNAAAWRLPPLKVCREWWGIRFGAPLDPWPPEDSDEVYMDYGEQPVPF